MAVKVVNEAILVENEQTIFVQRYIYLQRTYLVFRKPYAPNEQFVISDDAEHIEPEVSTWMTGSDDWMYDPDDELPEIFAMAYLDEEYPPKSEEYPPAALMVEYNTETKLYCYEVGIGIEVATAPTLQEAVEKGIDALYKQQLTPPIPVDTCPFCEAPTCPGDNFCLNCGELLPQS